jgi:hypothetical protein
VDAAEQLKAKLLSNGSDKGDDEGSQDDHTEPHTDWGYEDVPDEDRVLTRRILNRLLSSEHDETIYSQGKARIFALLCNVLEIDYTHVDLTRKSAKKILYDSILDFVGTYFLLLFTDLIMPSY